jgi:hypothetical protein
MDIVSFGLVGPMLWKQALGMPKLGMQAEPVQTIEMKGNNRQWEVASSGFYTY